MAVTVHIPGPLQGLTEGRRSVQLRASVKSLAEALEALFINYPGVRDRLLTEQGSVREHINIFIDKEDIRYLDGLATKLTDRAEIVILPAVSGGSSTQQRAQLLFKTSPELHSEPGS